MSHDLTERVFSTVDAAGPDAIAGLFAFDGRFRFGNDEPLVGRDAVAAGLAGFLASIAGLHHKIVNEWQLGPVERRRRRTARPRLPRLRHP
jgi:hypothetical protein